MRMNDKTKFQVERIALFSDAVFAIAITLMIIEVKPPHLPHHSGNAEAIMELLRLSPMFFGVVLSFIFIGIFWLRHHQIMKHITAYNDKLLILNLSFLLTIVFIPFSTAFVFENVSAGSVVPMVFYNVNYILANIFNYWLFAYILNPKSGIKAEDDPEQISEYSFELLYPVAVHLLVIAAAFIMLPYAAIFYTAFAFENRLNPKKRKERKLRKLMKAAAVRSQ